MHYLKVPPVGYLSEGVEGIFLLPTFGGPKKPK